MTAQARTGRTACRMSTERADRKVVSLLPLAGPSVGRRRYARQAVREYTVHIETPEGRVTDENLLDSAQQALNSVPEDTTPP
jgi:hypothetical protein